MTMIDALNNFVSRPVVGLILSALVGAAFGYGAAVIQSAQEAAAKQDVLIHALVDELKTIPESVPPYQVEKAFYRDPIRLSSPALLLDGEVQTTNHTRRSSDSFFNCMFQSASTTISFR